MLVVLSAAIIAFSGMLGWCWYASATSGQPYEEIGVELSSRMPAPLRRWACGRIRDRYPGTLPSSGCDRP